MIRIVDRIWAIPWKLNTTQSIAWGGDKTSGLLLSWEDCHDVWSYWNCNNVWSNWNGGYRFIAEDRTHQDEHNSRFKFYFTLRIESCKKHDVWRRQNGGFLLDWGDSHNVWYNRNCGYWLIAADRTRQDEGNGWSNAISPWKLNTAQSITLGREKTSGFLLASEDCHNGWSDWNCGYRLIVADRTHQDEHNGWFNLFITLKIESSTDNDVGKR